MEPLRWWAAIQLLGLLALPWTFRLLPALPDRGLPLAKVIGLLGASYLFWLLGLMGLARPGPPLLLALLLPLALASALGLWRWRTELLACLQASWPLLLISELLFLALLLASAWVRSLWPEISHTEQPMDFALLNASLRAERFPPHDPWLAGYPVSYYYFGYLMAAVLTHLTALPSSVAYNLALAGVAALAGVGAFSLASNLMRLRAGLVAALVAGLLAALLLLGMGNLEGALELAYAHRAGSPVFWSWVGIKGLTEPYQSGVWYPDQFWWWWRATRLIDTVVGGVSLDYTITEFPFFSFYLGDLHPHVMGLPLLLLAAALAFQLWRDGPRLPQLLLAGLVIGGAGFTNSWDLPVVAALVIVGMAGGMVGEHGSGWRRLGPPFLALLLAALLYLPFYASFRSQASGLLPVLEVGTRPVHAFLHWAPLAFGAGTGLLLLLMVERRWSWWLALPVPLGLLALWFAMAVGVSSAQGMLEGLGGRLLGRLGEHWWWALPLMGALGGVLRRPSGPAAQSRTFLLLLMAFATLLVGGAELFYVLDLFRSRMNTVFKLSYQAWALLAVVAACGYTWGLSLRLQLPWQRALQALWGLGAAVLILGALVYPTAVLVGQAHTASQRTLDGLAWLGTSNPDELAAARWLEARVEGAPVIAEAVGDSYGPSARLSSRTGLPTILGWSGHQIQWRGSSKLLDGRAEDMARLYGSGDPEAIAEVLARYNVAYVVIGTLERARYGEANLDTLRSALDLAFQQGSTALYRVPSLAKSGGRP